MHECNYDPQNLHYSNTTKSVGDLVRNFDVACLMYDVSERTSFQSAAQLYVRTCMSMDTMILSISVFVMVVRIQLKQL